MNPCPKQKVFRNASLLDLANEAPGCMNPHCGLVSPGEIVACHSNLLRHGKGMGLKASDCCAYLCRRCHDLVDGRAGNLTQLDREHLFFESAFETWLWLLQSGHLKVAA